MFFFKWKNRYEELIEHVNEKVDQVQRMVDSMCITHSSHDFLNEYESDQVKKDFVQLKLQMENLKDTVNSINPEYQQLKRKYD